MGNLDVKHLSTEALEEMLRYDDLQPKNEPNMEVLFLVMEELAQRYREQNPSAKTAEEALQEFYEDYYPELNLLRNTKKSHTTSSP